ncbi:MAG: diacylglycerol kinase family lipid kinase [Chloroflexi bacterium]|nr:diacylglycerol kinase family lipid kinase [Chloroflexota bacterium]
MRVKIIMNPWSDQRRAIQRKEQIEALVRQYGGAEIALTERPGHAAELARQAADDGYDLVVAAGGDGTVHEVVNGLVHGGKSETKLGVIPIGSGNDLAFGLGIPLEIEGAARRLFTGRERWVDLGRVEDEHGRFRYFDNNFGMGMDAMVVARTESINRVYGFFMYLVAVLQTIAFYYQQMRVEARFDDEIISQDTLLVALGIGPRGGGGFFLTPDAVQDDDLIQSCTVSPISRPHMIYLLVKSLKGRHVTSRYVTMRQNRRIVLKADIPVSIHVDGEMFAYPQDNVRQVTVTSVPKALRVVV